MQTDKLIDLFRSSDTDFVFSPTDQAGRNKGLSKIGWTMEMQGMLTTQSLIFNNLI